MSDDPIRIDLDDGGLGRALASLVAAGDDLTPLMDEIGSYLQMSTDHRFETETGPDGHPWPKSIRALAQGGQTLTDTARLRQSITHRASRDSVELGTNVIYAAIHQFGGRIVPKNGKALKFRLPDGGFATVGSVTIPRRAYLPDFGDADQTEIRAMVGDYLARAAGQ